MSGSLRRRGWRKVIDTFRQRLASSPGETFGWRACWRACLRCAPMACSAGRAKHLKLPRSFYSALHIVLVLGFMALARIRRPEGLRHIPPGEFGKVIGLDRAPEVRTLREKIFLMAIDVQIPGLFGIVVHPALAELVHPGGWIARVGH